MVPFTLTHFCSLLPLDGSFLGLSPYLSADVFNFAEPMVVDIKFGWKQKFHRLSTTGYALVMESLHEYPINIGCLVYASFKEKRLSVERDERMRMVSEEIDPGVAQGYPYSRECHPGVKIRLRARSIGERRWFSQMMACGANEKAADSGWLRHTEIFLPKRLRKRQG